MSLDPHIAGILKMMAASGKKPTHECTPEEARAGYLAMTRGTLSKQQVFEVATVENIVMPGEAGDIKARVYKPEGQSSKPIVVYFHGGGFVIGDLETHDNMCREISRKADCIVVSVEYRLAPEHPFPAAVNDALSATRWVVENASRIGGKQQISVAGDSAGGNLAAVVAQQLAKHGESIACQFLLYPALDNLDASYASRKDNATGYFLEAETLKWFIANYAGTLEGMTDEMLTPIHAKELAGLAPAIIVTAEYDMLRDEGEAYGKQLENAGVSTQVIRAPGMIHGFFDMGRWSPGAQRIIDDSILALKSVIH